MTNRALDEAKKYQREAADPAVNVFVTANAGSGKTKVLVDRIARLLLEGSKPSAFLCITYTKAAASEMQRRLFERLGGWCVADDATLAAELKELGANAQDLGRARSLFAQALETPGGLKIQTIHAFCERLLARFPLEAGVPPGFDIADEPRAAAMLAKARADAALAPDAPLEAFRRFAARRGGDQLDLFLDKLAMKRAQFHRFAQKHLGAVFAETVIRNRHRVRGGEAQVCERFLAAQDWPRLRDAARILAASSTNDVKLAARLKQALDAYASDVDPRAKVDASIDFAFNDAGDRYKTFGTAAVKKEHTWLEQALRDFADACADVRERLNAIDRAEDAAAALQLAAKLDDAYEAAKHRGGVLDFDDLIDHAQALLQRSEAAPWVLYKLDGGLDHILIDEGQDTSPAQWTLIDPLQNEFFAGAGARLKPRTVFAVGDPKQSIYGFQGADPQRFLSERQALSKRAHKAKQKFKGPELRTSFRSAPNVLAAVDAVFAHRELVSGAPDAHDKLEHLPARQADGGLLEVWPLAPRPERVEASAWDAPLDVETEASAPARLAREIARRIKASIDAREAVYDKDTRQPRPMQAGDVLALVRTRGVLFRELIKAFKRAGLPVAGADRMVLRDELAVEDCLALMRVALDPADDLALACVLKGPWCEWEEDADLFPLAYGRGRNETLMSRLMASTEPRHASAQAFVRDVRARCGADAFAFLSWALETPHGGGATGWSRVLYRLGAESRDPLEELLQRALKPAAFAAPTLQRFLSDIERDAGEIKRELEAETGAVRVMTVHGAKGLEAPVVILPDCTAPANDKTDEGIMFDDAGEPYISFSSKGDDEVVATARAAHEARLLQEHWRLLYVAMTRARDRLIVCGAARGNVKGGETADCWRLAVEDGLKALNAQPCETPFGEGLRIGAPFVVDAVEPTAGAAKLALPDWARTAHALAAAPALAAPSRVARIDPALFSPRGDGQRRFRRGRLIHGLLERLPDVAVERRHDVAISWLARQGAEEEVRAAYADEALRVINDPRFAAVFGPQSRAEAPIVGEIEGRPVSGIVDRLAIDDARVIVLDFKTDRPAPTDAAKAPEQYVLQLALYRAVLGKIFPRKAISCALLWTEAPHLMELPAERLDAALAKFLRG